MIFDSAIFIFAFLPIVVAALFFAPKQFSNLVLVFFSLIFYAWGNVTGLVILILSIGINYFGAIQIGKVRTNKKRAKKLLFIFCGIDLLLLVVCKYVITLICAAGFMAADNERFLAPIGISFYILQHISYLADVYFGETRVMENVVDYAAFISMFPKLIAGPLCVTSQFEKQLKNRKMSVGKLCDGVLLFVQGFAKKILLGGGMYVIYEEITNLPAKETSALTAWLGCFAFALRIYFEVGGYFDMGQGLAKMIGFELPVNMNYPLLSKGIMDFWSRFMTTLWDWFRNYIYIPISKGNVKGAYGFGCLGITWILMGIWHGMALHYILWGLYFAVLIYLEGFIFYGFLEKIPSFIRWIVTFFLLMFGWALFFNPTIQSTGKYILCLFGAGGNGFTDGRFVSLITDHIILWIAGILFATPLPALLYRKLVRAGEKWQVIVNALVYAVLFVLSVSAMMSGMEHVFYYLRF